MKAVLHRLTVFLLAASFPGAVNLTHSTDWLIDSKPFAARATLSADSRAITLENGLVRRVICLQPNAATVAFDNLMTGASLLRSVRPEAGVELNGLAHLAVGVVAILASQSLISLATMWIWSRVSSGYMGRLRISCAICSVTVRAPT